MDGVIEKQQSRVFKISPKTPYQAESPQYGIKDFNFGIGGGARKVVAKDMIENVRELVGNNTIDAAIPNFRVYIGSHSFRGAEALENSVASPLGSILRELKLDMSSPEAVYMSGYSVSWALSKSLQKANERVAEIKAGNISFITPEAREVDLKKNKIAGGLLGKFEKDLNTSLEDYATQHLPNTKYQEILQSLAFIGGSQSVRLIDPIPRNRIVALLKKRDIDQAYEILQETPRAK